LIVDGYVEDASATAHQLAVDAELCLDRRRQTGGSRKVVSNAAVVDPDMHERIFDFGFLSNPKSKI
jgi:hypothetical protein